MKFLSPVLTCCIFWTINVQSEVTRKQRPNLIFFLADDLVIISVKTHEHTGLMITLTWLVLSNYDKSVCHVISREVWSVNCNSSSREYNADARIYRTSTIQCINNTLIYLFDHHSAVIRVAVMWDIQKEALSWHQLPISINWLGTVLSSTATTPTTFAHHLELRS